MAIGSKSTSRLARSVAVVAVGVALWGGMTLPAGADSIPVNGGAGRCGWYRFEGMGHVFYRNCSDSSAAIIKVKRRAWRDATYCVEGGRHTRFVGYWQGAGPLSVSGGELLGYKRHC